MQKLKRIFFVADTEEYSPRMLKLEHRRYVKGLVRLGYDVQSFGYKNAFFQGGALMGMRFMKKWCKSRVVDAILVKQIKNYNPDIVIVHFCKYLDAETIKLMQQAAPNAMFVGKDADLWPELHENRVEAAAEIGFVITTYAGKGLSSYKDAGIRCAFLPISCDPDIEHSYEALPQWQSDIMFTGQERINHERYPTEDTRYRLVSRLAEMKNCALYGCCGRPKIGGINYLYAISGAKIGLSVNAMNDIRLYHSDRLITYLSCGTFALAKRVPDTELLFKDGVHLKYFDTVDEFFELADWYLRHDEERKKIAEAGMQHAHTEFNCVKMAQYLLDLIEKGSYSAPWVVG